MRPWQTYLIIMINIVKPPLRPYNWCLCEVVGGGEEKEPKIANYISYSTMSSSCYTNKRIKFQPKLQEPNISIRLLKGCYQTMCYRKKLATFNHLTDYYHLYSDIDLHLHELVKLIRFKNS